jgi:hypothetical protein
MLYVFLGTTEEKVKIHTGIKTKGCNKMHSFDLYIDLVRKGGWLF